MRNKYLLLMSLALVVTLSAGCSSTKSNIADEPPEVLYQKAQAKLDAGNYSKAAELLAALDSRYPFGPYSSQVQLDLIYAYYKQDDVAQAIAHIDRFLRLSPTHKDVDYVLYMRGLTHMGADHNFFQGLFNITRDDKDPGYARQAFRDFKSLLKAHPTSPYAADARARMIALKSRLAKHDLSVANFYVQRNALIAAANRAQLIVEEYQDSPEVERALEIMVSAYDTLDLPTLAENARKVLATNYPQNRLARG